MPSVNPSAFGPKPAFFDASGTPDLSYKLFAYVAGSTSTKQNTYTNSTGNVANPNPIILNALGQTPNGFWWTSGQIYKIVLAPATDTDPPTNPIWTVDNLQGMNDAAAAAAADEWQLFSAAPAFVSTTSFTLTGNQTDVFQVGRRIRTTNTAGPVYSTIISSVFAGQTIVTVANTSGALDSGLSAVYYGILSSLNPSYPPFSTKGPDVASASTVILTTTTGDSVNLTGTTPVTAWTMLAGQRMRVNFTAATPITYNAITNQIQGGSSITGEVGSYLELYYDGTTTFVTYILGNGAAASGPSYTMSPPGILTTGTSLTANAVGICTPVNSATATSTNLMALSTLFEGQVFTLQNTGVGVATFNRVGSDLIYGGNLIAATSFSLNQGEAVTLTKNNGIFLIVSSTATLRQVGSILNPSAQTFTGTPATDKFVLTLAAIASPAALVVATSSQFVIQVAGTYDISFSASGSPAANGFFLAQGYKNGVVIPGLASQLSAQANVVGSVSSDRPVDCAIGDVIDLRGTPTTASWTTIAGTAVLNIVRTP